MATPGDHKLTVKQQRFVDEYLLDLCATRAAVRAGYSRDTAAAIGYENLRKPEIRKAINEAIAERSERTGITADRVIRELAAIAFSDIRDIAFDKDGKLDVAVPEAARAVAGYAVDRTDTPDGPRTRVTLKLHDKLKALDLFMHHFGLVSANLPPLEVLLHRLPPHVSSILRHLLAGPASAYTAVPGLLPELGADCDSQP